jgi:meso-butanediol dehydrogenase / (S,S)-butanediol dehydrogenase / diacetyl reductase
MSGRLKGKVAIVTGAGRGIGEGVARRFAREGAAVVAAQRTYSEVERVVDTIVQEGGSAIPIETDVRDEQRVRNLIDTTLENYGRLDVLCNNAGVGLLRTVVESTMEEYDYVLEQGTGSVINVASVASFVGFRRDAAYCASKGAVLMLTRQTALDFAPNGVRVNAICPGFIDTPMLRLYCESQPNPDAAWSEVLAQHPIGRLGTVDDIAGAALYLASDDSTWVTGVALPVDGGLLCQ